ncbi:hypothetical protein ACET3Z_032471 [Daucus carota]
MALRTAKETSLCSRCKGYPGLSSSWCRSEMILIIPLQIEKDFPNMQDDITSTQQNVFYAPNTSADISIHEQPADLNPRRQSTSNRAPTARALEALVNGDLTASSGRIPKD